MLPTHRPPTHPGEMFLKEFLERMTKAVDRLVAMAQGHFWRHDPQEPANAPVPGILAKTDEFRTRLDLGNGPEVIMIERK